MNLRFTARKFARNDFLTEIPASESADWRFDDLSLVIINCGGDHCNLTGEYAAIRAEMEDHIGKSMEAIMGRAIPAKSLPTGMTPILFSFA